MVIVFVEATQGVFKKPAFEVVTYGYQTAQVLGTDCVALVFGSSENAAELGVYGAQKVYVIEDEKLAQLDAQVYTSAIAAASERLGGKVLVMAHNSTGKSILGRLAARFSAASVPGANAVPKLENGRFLVRKPVFSGKALASVELLSDYKVISVTGNSIPPQAVSAAATVEKLSVSLPAPRVTVTKVEKQEGTVPLPEAELVVSAGRGMKGPENWGIIEDLAAALGATTACSRPVSDVGWRPHHEHVGQTGIAIRPNLYIAAGISGAIQHLAGVNSSKTIVVINKDPEAPFFKAADYGVVGDLFEVVPKLTAAIKKMKA